MVSAYPLFKILREAFTSSEAHARYHIKMIHDKNKATFGSQTVVLHDEFLPSDYDREDRVNGTVKTIVNGQDYPLHSLVVIRPYYNDANRYWSWVGLAYVNDRDHDAKKLAVVQRIDLDFGEVYNHNQFGQSIDLTQRYNSYDFRILWLDGHRGIVEERFNFRDRAKPLYRTPLAGKVFPTMISYYYQDTAVWPTYLTPMLYPLLTGILGVFFTVIGAYQAWTSRRHQN